jgi:DeoR family transcriptional regulator, suf operon transcriptional repressor
MNKLTARQRVLAYLIKQPGASAIQIGRALKISAASIRHHLSILITDGRVVTIGETRNKGRGRPVKIYKLSEKLLGDNLSLLSSALLKSRLKKIPSSKQRPILNSVAVELADQIGRTNLNDPIARRLTNLLEKLNEMHYQSRWEAGAEGPRMLFGHCPYAAIIDKHPELCQMDRYLLGEEIGTDARQLAKIEQKPGGITHCIFLIT